MIRSRCVAPELTAIRGPLAPAAGQFGTLAEQWAKAQLPRPTGRPDRPLTRAEVKAFAVAAVQSVLATMADRGAA